ncbi:MAG: hypothetical protein E4G91_05645 [Candidatus Zixiibacteriota bacterium]|nr:MAG: hypothetical protein E4G91_05645 [candidate division Zixibacteria bacterium]
MLGRINWHPTRRDLRYFAVTLAIVVALFALILVLGGRYRSAGWFAVIGLAVSLACYSIPSVGRLVYFVWMAVTYVFGRIVSPVVTAIIFYLLVTPIALINRLMGKDRLQLKKSKDASTYFVDHTDAQDKESFRRQF